MAMFNNFGMFFVCIMFFSMHLCQLLNNTQENINGETMLHEPNGNLKNCGNIPDDHIKEICYPQYHKSSNKNTGSSHKTIIAMLHDSVRNTTEEHVAGRSIILNNCCTTPCIVSYIKKWYCGEERYKPAKLVGTKLSNETSAQTSTDVPEVTTTEPSETTPTDMPEVTTIYVTKATVIFMTNASTTFVTDALSTDIINATSADVTNTTSTDATNATSTDATNATSTEVINATLTDVTNVTLTDVTNVTLTDVTNVTLTDVTNVTSTEVINATSTQVTNATSIDVNNSALTTTSDVTTNSNLTTPMATDVSEFETTSYPDLFEKNETFTALSLGMRIPYVEKNKIRKTTVSPNF